MQYVVAYARFSSDNQREESIDAQLRAIRQYCESKGYILVNTYVDEARSATTDDRPSFQRMISDAVAGQWEAVIVHKLDRFSRNRYDSAIYKKQLRDVGVRVESVLEHLDDSPESVILESLLEGMSEYYSKNLAREVRKGQQENALKCRHNGGPVLYGYKLNEDMHYIINEAEAVRIAYEMVAQGSSYSEVIALLTERGYKTRNGRKFCTSTLLHMLRNEKYNGTYTYNRTLPQTGGKRTNESRPDDQILRIPDGMPAIVDMQTWQDVQDIIKRRSTQSAKAAKRAKEVYLLQGLIKCGNCGTNMVGTRVRSNRDNKTRIYYECNGRKRKTADCKMRRISRDYVEGLVIDYIEKYILSDSAMERVRQLLIDEMEREQAASPSGVAGLKKELADTERSIDNLIDAIAAGVDAVRLRGKIDALEAKRAELEHRINLLEARNAPTQLDLSGLDAIIAKYRNIRGRSREEQKEIINRFVSEVIVYDNDDDGDKVILTMNYSKTLVPLKIKDAARGGLSPVKQKHDCSGNRVFLCAFLKPQAHYQATTDKKPTATKAIGFFDA